MVRLAHFSDIHLTARPLGWRVRDAFNKRPTGWVNVKVLGRGHRFRHANDVTAALRREFAGRGFDQLVFSGDATTLGFPAGHGDLLVMGGSCQRTWEHAVLKSARPCGPRISVQFRPRGVL